MLPPPLPPSKFCCALLRACWYPFPLQVRVKCVGQELNIVTRPGVVPSPLDHESHTLTVRPQSPLDVNSQTLWAYYLFINF